jgi:hypothetical protein
MGLFGIVLFGALIANLAQRSCCASWAAHSAMRLILLIAGNLAIFFIWTFPTNQATNNWTVVPKNCNVVRIQWEY